MSGDEDCVTYLGVPCDSNFGSENFKPVIMNYSLGNSTLNVSPDGLALDGPSTYVEVAIFVIVCFANIYYSASAVLTPVQGTCA